MFNNVTFYDFKKCLKMKKNGILFSETTQWHSEIHYKAVKSFSEKIHYFYMSITSTKHA